MSALADKSQKQSSIAVKHAASLSFGGQGAAFQVVAGVPVSVLSVELNTSMCRLRPVLSVKWYSPDLAVTDQRWSVCPQRGLIS